MKPRAAVPIVVAGLDDLGFGFAQQFGGFRHAFGGEHRFHTRQIGFVIQPAHIQRSIP